MKTIACSLTLLLTGGLAFAQSGAGDPAKFDFADIHPSPKAQNVFMAIAPLHNNRFEIHNATMVDLIRQAFDYDTDKIVGGPSWLEMDRFDVIVKTPAGTSMEAARPMLQTLLADRIHLVSRKETRPLPTYVLTAGKKPQMKQADGSGDTGCRMQSSAAPVEGGVKIGINGTPITLGPGMTISYACRNMTMDAFASGMRGMLGAAVGNNPVLNQTGLEGAWNFDVKWSLQMLGGPASDTGDRISVFDAVEKQLGLKLEQKPNPTPVLVVESVDEKPSPNPPGTAEALPLTPPATAFEVADVKPSDPDSNMSRMQMQPGGRLLVQGMPMQFLLTRAFNTQGPDELVNIPKWASSTRFDVTAKAPADAGPVTMLNMGPLLRNLLEDRFKLKWHIEERPLSAYTLVAAKPKLKKADPGSRTSCKINNGPTGQGTIVFTCQNMTMAQFAEQLQGKANQLSEPVLDATELQGNWDISFTFNRLAGMNIGGPGRGGDGPASPADTVAASDPGGGLSIFEAMEKQLGLKLEMQKRPLPVTVIDHLEEKPTDN